MAEVKNTGRHIEIPDPEPIPSLRRPSGPGPSMHPGAGPRPPKDTTSTPGVVDDVSGPLDRSNAQFGLVSSNKPKTEKMLLLGMGIVMSVEEIKKLKAQLKPDFPDHRIMVIPGMMSATEFEVPVEVKSDEKSGSAGYL